MKSRALARWEARLGTGPGNESTTSLDGGPPIPIPPRSAFESAAGRQGTVGESVRLVLLAAPDGSLPRTDPGGLDHGLARGPISIEDRGGGGPDPESAWALGG